MCSPFDSFFGILECIGNLLPLILRRLFQLSTTLFLSFLLFSSILVYWQFGEYITYSKVQFVLRNPEYFKTFIRTYLLNFNILIFVLLWIFLSWLWINRTKKNEISWIRQSIILLILIVIFLTDLNQISLYGKNNRMTIDASFAVAIKDLKVIRPAELQHRTRTTIMPFKPHEQINIILIINESFGRKAFDDEHLELSPMTFLVREVQNNVHCISFRQAFTNSSATDVSVPSILSGVAPYESANKLHQMPLLWDWGHAASMSTILFSAQDYRWANFREFFLTPGPDSFLTPTELDIPLTNDFGIDELIAMDEFCSLLLHNPPDKTFLAVYNSDALHSPFQQDSKYLDHQPKFKSRYMNGAVILDEAFRRLWNTLEITHKINNTLLIITSDHGETDSLIHHTVNRLYNFYDEVMRIPFFVFIPPCWDDEHPDFIRNLHQNKMQTISNLDIIPTILHVLGAQNNNRSKLLVDELQGKSLFQSIPVERFSIALNTNDVRQWEHEGFGIYWKTRRFVFSDIEGRKFFDITTDPNQLIDIWSKVDSTQKHFFANIINSTFHLKRIYGERR